MLVELHIILDVPEYAGMLVIEDPHKTLVLRNEIHKEILPLEM
jgi:hypothetical protein